MKRLWSWIRRAWSRLWNDWRIAWGVGFASVFLTALTEPHDLDNWNSIVVLALLAYLPIRRMFVAFAHDRMTMDALALVAATGSEALAIEVRQNWAHVSMRDPDGNIGFSILHGDTIRRLRRSGDWPPLMRRV